MWTTYILYQHLLSSQAGVSSLEVKCELFRYRDEETWQKYPDKYSQHKIVDLQLSSMSQELAVGRSLHSRRI